MSFNDPKCQAYSQKIERRVMGALTLGLLSFLAIFWLVLAP